jgi:hypothetical protein
MFGYLKIISSAQTNEFKNEGQDNYTLVKQVSLSDGKTIVDVSKMPFEFYKIVLETPQDFLNRWLILK